MNDASVYKQAAAINAQLNFNLQMLDKELSHLRLQLYTSIGMFNNGAQFDKCGLEGCTKGFDFPRGPGAYAPRFCCGLLDFSG